MIQKVIQKVEYLLAMAWQDYKRGNMEDASKMYSCAMELANQAVSQTTVLCIVCIGIMCLSVLLVVFLS